MSRAMRTAWRRKVIFEEARAAEDLDTFIPEPCTLCGGTLVILGHLGNLVHSRCQDCGAVHSDPADPLQEGA